MFTKTVRYASETIEIVFAGGNVWLKRLHNVFYMYDNSSKIYK